MSPTRTRHLEPQTYEVPFVVLRELGGVGMYVGSKIRTGSGQVRHSEEVGVRGNSSTAQKV